MKCYKILFAAILMMVCIGDKAAGKSIDENTARTVGLNFLLAKGVQVPEGRYMA